MPDVVTRRGAVTLLFACPVVSSTKTAFADAAVLIQLVDVLKNVQECIRKIGYGFRDLLRIGADGFDSLVARQTHARLIEIYTSLGDVAIINGMVVHFAFDNIGLCGDHYCDRPWIDREKAWRDAKNVMIKGLTIVKKTLDGVRSERSDFVLEPAFVKLEAVLSGRRLILEELQFMQLPRSAAEISLLSDIAYQYRGLIRSLNFTMEEMATYIKRH
jgi:hypothetical protein